MKEIETYNDFISEKKLTWAEKEQIVEDYYSKIEILSGEILEFIKNKGYDIYDNDKFISNLDKFIQKNVDFHLPD